MLSSFTSPLSPFHFLPKLSPRDLVGTYRFLTSGLGLRTNTAQLSGRFEARNQVSGARSHSHNTASNKVCSHSTNARMAQGQSRAPTGLSGATKTTVSFSAGGDSRPRAIALAGAAIVSHPASGRA